MANPTDSKIDWQLTCEKTRQRLSHLLHTNLWSDCTFLVGDEKPEIVTAHTFVLAMSSPVFETMFYGSMPENKGSTIRVPDVQPQAFRTMLKFLYTDEAQLCSYLEASEVYCVARKYMLPFIQNRCVSHLQWNLTPSNACFAHEFANLFEEKDLLKAVLKTFRRKTKEVLKEGSFYEAHIKTVATLFSQEQLDIDSELDLFKALEKYAEETMGLSRLKRHYDFSDKMETLRKRKRMRIESTDDDKSSKDENDTEMECQEQDKDEKRLISDIRLALSHIRFLTLSAREFAVAARSVLLSDEEALAVMLNIAGVRAPLPAGLSAHTERRGLREWSPDYSESDGNSAASRSLNRRASTASCGGGGGGGGGAEGAPECPYEAMCVWTVFNFKTRKRAVRSAPFSTDHLQWCVNLVPDSEPIPTGGEQKTLGILVECTNSGGGKTWSCRAHVTIALVSHSGQQLLKRSFTHTYDSTSTSNGYRALCPWATACAHYVQSNTLRVHARVVAAITN